MCPSVESAGDRCPLRCQRGKVAAPEEGATRARWSSLQGTRVLLDTKHRQVAAPEEIPFEHVGRVCKGQVSC